jgi:N-acetylmuramoyl-L-alanine amidase
MVRVKQLLAATAALGLAASAQAATVKSVTIEPVGADVRVVIAFDDRFDAPSAFALDAPMRLVVDLPGNKTDTRRYGGQGSVTGARSAQFAANKARLVLDLDAPMMVADSVAADNKLTLTLKPADATAFAKLTRGRARLPGIDVPKPVEVARSEAPANKPEPTPAAKPEAPPASNAESTVAPVQVASKSVGRLPPAPAKAEVKPVQQVALAPKSVPVRPAIRGGSRPLVVIDAGHGGHDVGALSVLDQKREKDVTLAIARAIQRELEASGRVRVMLTRTDDRFLPLPQRVAIAQRAKANLFISVHADSAPVPEARGATVYTLSEIASDREAARLAAKENKSDILAGFNVPLDNVDVADILIDLAQRETMNVSASFAAVLQREMSPKVHFKSNAHRFAGFRVLKAADVPSVLLETGYLSNGQDSEFLFSKAGQQAIAEGVSKAVEAHFMRRIAQR